MKLIYLSVLLLPMAGFSAPIAPLMLDTVTTAAPVIDAGLKIEPTEPKKKPVAKKPVAKKPVAKKKAPVRKKKAPVRKKRVVKRAPPKPKVYKMDGTWDWVAICPVIGQVTGVTSLKSGTGANFTGALRTSLKQKAKVNGTVKGRNFAMVERYGFVKVTGQHTLSADGRSFKGAVNNGCKVTGKRR